MDKASVDVLEVSEACWMCLDHPGYMPLGGRNTSGHVNKGWGTGGTSGACSAHRHWCCLQACMCQWHASSSGGRQSECECE